MSSNNDQNKRLSSTGDSLYKTLEVTNSATFDEIKKNYRRLVLRHHPDKNPVDLEAGEKTKEINRAYSILIDKKSRRIYDDSEAEKIKKKNVCTCVIL